MKLPFKTLLVAAAFITLSTTSCSDKQQENAGAAADNAAATTENAANNAGNAMENAADNVKSDMAREKGDTAVVVAKPADKIIEKTPATQK